MSMNDKWLGFFLEKNRLASLLPLRPHLRSSWLKKMSKTKKCRNMTKEEKKNFDNFQMSFHYIK